MALDYTVIVNVRQQFGEEDRDIGAYAGTKRVYEFDCPDVDTGQRAVLTFQALGLGGEQRLEINGRWCLGGFLREVSAGRRR